MTLLPQFRSVLAFMDPLIHEFGSAGDQRSVIAGALYDVVHEHAKGICILLEQNYCASAFALTRILFETFVRAAWLLHCATDKELQTFVEKDKVELESKNRFSFGDMIKAVESVTGWPDTLSDIKNRAWGALNSYTHGGQYQLSQRYDGCTIQPHYDPDQAADVVKFSAMISFLSFCEIAEISESKELQQRVAELYEKISPWCFNS